MMEGVDALGYLGFSVSDLDRWVAFATDVLGLAAQARGDGAVDLRLDGYAWRIRLHPDGEDDIAYAGWEVRDAAGLAAVADRLGRAGVPVRRGSAEQAADRSVQDLVCFEDPEGLSCEVFYGALQRTDRPFVSPLGVGFKTGRQGLGHVVLRARDRAALTAFYTHLLGMRISDHIETEAAPGRPMNISFLRCNARHHSLALVDLPLSRRLQHFMLETRGFDDVGRALYRGRDAGVHEALTLGRHSNDEMVSFYMQTPSGFDVEYGWGGVAVDDETWHVVTHQCNSAWGHRFQRPPQKGAR